ncbi:MAG: NAD-dependent epimerase/dehydratase family protein [Candidatus Aminicenantes bacterium]|nr:NAD-dependent epimerase/dehydratase family protein [Candidatus Aminicenantes bacterium]NIM82534.1 NAD-dependent epimerase/dehydratase family protein [Candidatus Aminicenantes bacterium]NIN21892.1 NAD-dependent epimerase/dehydratase family protein [Candidatus Aminicenantes bacterium]NIN45670.1 NAD-dependent epimerase/dehydratase family protein [Candidatus Aminicenantes bacterium]NIN88503.1 NAD-dependent epimerase/dehydratase family protein [Candidatus Aminicenantes bacterium]
MISTRSKRVLVTGGRGFLGRAVVERLVKRGDRVCSFSRGYYEELESMGVVTIQGDLSDGEALDRAVNGMDLVFHVAGKPGIWGKYSDFYQANYMGTKHVVDACIKHKVPALVYTSSPAVVVSGKDLEGVDESAPYPDRFHSHYAKTKAMAEQYVTKKAKEYRNKKDGLKAISLRPHLIWGPGDNHIIPRIIARAKRLVRVGRRNCLIDTVYIDNAADAHILAADKLETNPELSGKVYFISQGEPLAIWDMVNRILKSAHLEPVERSVPYPVVWLIGSLLEIIYKIFRLPGEPLMTRFIANELATAHWFDISAARRDLGYNPKISIEAGLIRLEEWLQKNHPSHPG